MLNVRVYFYRKEIAMIQLEKLVKKNLPKEKEGKVASYIPALAEVDPKQLGVALYDLEDGEVGEAGQSEVRFAIESISKVTTLMLAIKKMGLQEVFKHVGSRQTGFAFNSILNMEIERAKYPLNPFINAGAIATTSMVVSKTGDDAFEEILDFARDICNDPNLYLDQVIYHSERRTGNLDRSLAYYMESKNMLLGDVVTSLDTYFKQCSMMVTARSLANLGAVLANGGVKPWDNKRIIPDEEARCIKSLMMTTGLYNQSGTYSRLIGVPTKSGVGGGLMSAAPHRYGIGIFSPALDKDGNSIAGLDLLRDIVDGLELDIFD